MKNWEKKHFHGNPKSPKQTNIKTKIKSEPIQQKNSIKSIVPFPNLKKMKEYVPELVPTIWWWQICSLTVLMPIDFSFPMCLQRCSKSEEGRRTLSFSLISLFCGWCFYKGLRFLFFSFFFLFFFFLDKQVGVWKWVFQRRIERNFKELTLHMSIF